MTNNQVSEFIAVLMGIEFIIYYENGNPRNQILGKVNSKTGEPFNAFSPDGIWEWREWMETNIPEVWRQYCDDQLYAAYVNIELPEAINIILNPSNFAEWMAGNVELWAYVECDGYEGDDTCSGHMKYPVCDDAIVPDNGPCKIINPKYAKAVEWLKENDNG